MSMVFLTQFGNHISDDLWVAFAVVLLPVFVIGLLVDFFSEDEKK